MEIKLTIGYTNIILITVGKWYATLSVDVCGVQNYWRIGAPPNLPEGRGL